jgi:superoxide dismutase, Cu-Zn family
MDTGRNEARPRRARRWLAIGASAALLGGLVALTMARPAEGDGWEAKAILSDTSGVTVGTVRFEGDQNGTIVKVVVNGVTVGLDSFHGFHIHANDGKAPCDPTTGFTNVGGHWNPSGVAHGHHHGDLPSVLIQADGSGDARTVTGRFEPDELAGRAVIVHAGPDNFANIPNRYAAGNPPVTGPDSTTTATGDAGGRIACGIVVVD